MVAAAVISNRLGILESKEVTRLKKLIIRAGLPTKIQNLSQEKLIQAMGHDKKIMQGKVKYILPETIGKVFITDEVDPSLVEQVLVEGNGET